MRRAPRHGALVFENNIRELQTSVEWTGVAAGSLPRVPGSPSRRAGRPARGGVLARRALRTSDVVRRQSAGQPCGNAVETRARKSAGRSKAGDHTCRIVRTILERARARAPRDRHERRRLDRNDSNATPSPEERTSRGSRRWVTSETSSPEANDRSGNGNDPQRGTRASSRMGSGAGQPHCDEGV